ncbi:MAG TPA: endonuclease/exonuclease/phosphatase family protein [Marmoricola sp.]|nr:endonuclease/exonuclease/phosphatase family protein [Marmoricola sp.]
MRSRLLALVVAVVTALGLALVPLTAAEAKKPAQHKGKPLTVMTRNLYLGADINRPVVAALQAQAAHPGNTPEDKAAVLDALANATHYTRAIVDQTNFNVRARLLAKEFKKTKPDLVGLQEVALWRHGPLQLDQVGVPNATEVDYDYLAILLKALRKQGMHYQAVQVGDRADVEAPSYTGSVSNGTVSSDARDVRLTMRDVILKRKNSGVKVLDTGNALYSHNLELTVAGVTFSFARGYNWVDVRHGSKKFRFINTHLEAFGSDYAYAQAQELLAAAPSPTRTNVLVCDCNSDPLNDTVIPGETHAHSAPYKLITQTGGFTDEWLRWKPAAQGWTSGLSELVNDASPAGFNHRIDMVFARKAGGGGLRVDRGWVTGTKLKDRDPKTGLWPSDHGGVVLRLRGL